MFSVVLLTFHARVKIPGLFFEYLVKQTNETMGMNVMRNFQVFAQCWSCTSSVCAQTIGLTSSICVWAAGSLLNQLSNQGIWPSSNLITLSGLEKEHSCL